MWQKRKILSPVWNLTHISHITVIHFTDSAISVHGKVVPVLKYYSIKTYGGVEIMVLSLLTPERDGDEFSDLRFPSEKSVGIHRLGRLSDQQCRSGYANEENNSRRCRQSNSGRSARSQ
jgi:hypothetical protein